ncbi:MAG: hypothetical protein WAT93_14705 [Pontixanthobacter sp.]
MIDSELANGVWLLGALILAGSALTGYRLSWRKSVVYVLIWGAIFAGVALLIDVVR